MFVCDKCGSCCRNIRRNEIYSFLDRGDGVCRYFDCGTYLCTIYNDRPLICNVDRMYDMFFSCSMTREEYYDLNHEYCRKLKDEFRAKTGQEEG